METIQSPNTMQRRALELKHAGRRIGFVPTMGFLHEGHLSLMRLAREQCDVLVASIFVNPAQFGPNEDLAAYPRDFARDESLCQQAGVDLLFFPEPKTMYAEDASVWIDEESLSAGLCGAARPGHFRGVCTIVAKLFNLVLPELAVFGEKDAQQLRIVERMVRDLAFPVEIVRGPIVREPDGLAMSSRNKYLSEQQREEAPCLRRALDLVLKRFENGEREAAALRQAMVDSIASVPGAELDYAVVVNDETLAEIEQVKTPALVALAVKFGAVRLIDNTILHL